MCGALGRWARRASSQCRNESHHTTCTTLDSKFEPWLSEDEHATPSHEIFEASLVG